MNPVLSMRIHARRQEPIHAYRSKSCSPESRYCRIKSHGVDNKKPVFIHFKMTEIAPLGEHAS